MPRNSINLSQDTLHDPHFAPFVAKQVEAAKIPGETLSFEVMCADAMKLTPVKYTPTTSGGEFVTDGTADSLASRNLANVLVVEPRYADPLSLVFYKKVLVTKAAIEQLKEMFA